MYKNFSSFFQPKSYKDPQCVTNTCTTDVSYGNKSGSGKFTRKQDVSLIEKKKKLANDQASLLCYLTPKHHEQSAKLIKQRIRDSCGQLVIDQCRPSPIKQLTTKASSGKFSFKGFEPYRPVEKRTSIQKRSRQSEQQNKFITVSRNTKQSADKSFTLKEPTITQKDKSGTKISRLNDTRRQEEKQPTDKNKTLNSNYQKQLKKLKNQCQHYSNLLQVSTKQRLQSQTQVKSLNLLISELKQKNISLSKGSEELSREILQLNGKMNIVSQEKDRMKKENSMLGEEKVKLEEEVCYLKDTVKELNERIQLMLQAEKELKVDSKPIYLIPSQHTHSRRFNSILVSPQSSLQQGSQQQSRIVHQLRDQLKYSQVQISMLKRVKMDINKKNQQFIKLQKQNKLLKNQLFDMKTSSLFDEPTITQTHHRSTARLHNQNKAIAPNSRNNFQLGIKRTTRADQRSDSLSSDTLSLNLSLSPDKSKHNSNTHRV